MKIIAKSGLKKFWERPGCADARGPLHSWYEEALKANAPVTNAPRPLRQLGPMPEDDPMAVLQAENERLIALLAGVRRAEPQATAQPAGGQATIRWAEDSLREPARQGVLTPPGALWLSFPATLASTILLETPN